MLPILVSLEELKDAFEAVMIARTSGLGTWHCPNIRSMRTFAFVTGRTEICSWE